jgi:hypothetical protein
MHYVHTKYVKVKVVDLNEILIACCGNSLPFVRRFDIEKDGISMFSLRKGYVEPVQIKISFSRQI